VSEVCFRLTPRRVRTVAGSAPVAINGTRSPANVQASAQAPFTELPVPQHPEVTLTASAHVVAAECADADNVNPNPGLPEPSLEEKQRVIFSCLLSFLTSP